jgi:hypothetical protein
MPTGNEEWEEYVELTAAEERYLREREKYWRFCDGGNFSNSCHIMDAGGEKQGGAVQESYSVKGNSKKVP